MPPREEKVAQQTVGANFVRQFLAIEKRYYKL